jgi:hypothetical protein
LIHTTNLPIINDNLDHALTVLETDISPWADPAGWVRADAQHVCTIVKGIATITKTYEIECATFDGAIPYQVSQDLAWAPYVI